MDYLMFLIYRVAISYHAFRGSGLNRPVSMSESVKATWQIKKAEKPLSEFQASTWKIMNEVAQESRGAE